MLRILTRSVLITLITAITIVGIVHAPFISVQSVSISPDSDVDQLLRTEILAHTKHALKGRKYGIPKKTWYFFNKDGFETTLRETFSRADAIAVQADLFNTWSITAKRRRSFGTHCTKKQCLVVDTKGIAFMKTNIRIGNTLIFSDTIQVGDSVFTEGTKAVQDFQKIPEVVVFLENNGLPVKAVLLQRDTRVVRVDLESGIGILFDASEALYDTTRALHIVFKEIFTDTRKQTGITLVDVRNPLSILYEKT